MNNFLLFFWGHNHFLSAAEYRRRAEQFGRDCAGAELRDSDLQRNRHSAINGPLAARGRQTHQHQPNTCRYVTHLIVYIGLIRQIWRTGCPPRSNKIKAGSARDYRQSNLKVKKNETFSFLLRGRDESIWRHPLFFNYHMFNHFDWFVCT